MTDRPEHLPDHVTAEEFREAAREAETLTDLVRGLRVPRPEAKVLAGQLDVAGEVAVATPTAEGLETRRLGD